jgi:hypothetical protein
MVENNQAKSKPKSTNSNGRGGARKGAGRKAGSATKKTREIADRAAASGVTPLDVMLDNMLFAHRQAGDVLAKLIEAGAEVPDGFDSFKELMRFRTMAQDAAKDAAPYMHPRLAAVEMTHGGSIGRGAQDMTDDELAAIAAGGGAGAADAAQGKSIASSVH